MTIGLCKELYTTGLVEFLQFLKNLRGMHFKLFHTNTRKRECHLEELTVLLNHGKKRVEGRHIAALGCLSDGTLVLVIVVIVMVGTDIEETIAFQMGYLMDFKI